MHLHLIGICGTGMAGLARLLQELGHRVTGSDAHVYPPMSDVLQGLGITVKEGYAAGNLTPAPDRVVVGNAIARGNPELETALDAGLDYTSMAEAVEDLVLPGRLPVVVTGTHGKTTTTALITHLLREAGLEPGWLVGGLAHDLPSTACLGRGREFVIEGDEYDTAYFDKRPKFHHYRPRLLLVLNLEFDHADIYPDLEAIVTEFRRLVNTVPRSGAVIGPSAPGPARQVLERAHGPVILFGEENEAHWRLGPSSWQDGAQTLELWPPHGESVRVRLPLRGRHNALNALAALAAAEQLGLPRTGSVRALGAFRGVARRLELRATLGGVGVWDDFAHHPTAVRASIQGVQQSTGAPVWAVLEPRSWSMRFNVHQATLADALTPAEHVVLAPVFEPHKVPDSRRLDTRAVVETLRQRGRDAHQVEGVEAIARFLAERSRPGDQILIMSNGGFDGLHDLLLAELER